MLKVYEQARLEAAGLLKTEWDGTFPVKLSPLTAVLGATVHAEPLGDELSGMIVKESGLGAQIVLNSSQSASRRRFTWAHELGHLVERSTVAKDDEYSFSDFRRANESNLHEFYANEFAGALLMPASEIHRRKREGWTNTQLAHHFGVSLSALTTRMARLKMHPEP